MQDSEFDWSNKTLQIFVGGDPIAVYENNDRDIVIRKQATYGIDDEDKFIVIPRLYVPVLIHALKQL
jgi:hypothetical protein